MRGIVAVALAFGLTPVVVQGAELPTDAWGLAGLLGKEILVGAAYAYTLAALFAALEVAGSFLDTLIGFSFGGLIDPITGNQNAVLARMYSLIGLMIFIAIGGDTWVIQGLARTYEVIGIDQTPAIGTLVAGASQAFASIFLSAIQVAGPDHPRADPHRRGVRRRLPRRAAAQRLRRRLPRQGDRRPRCSSA